MSTSATLRMRRRTEADDGVKVGVSGRRRGGGYT